MDKFSAIWLSHSSISNFKNCPRSYYLSTIYRDPRTGHKITLTTPAMSLGYAVHDVLESLSILKTADRFNIPLLTKFENSWAKVSGQIGGFENKEIEAKYKNRGIEMLTRVSQHKGPLAEKAVKINMDLPQYWLSPEDGLMLCGKLDWLQYNPDDDSVSILDFKTGTKEEAVDSLQLPIYYLLAHNCQTRKVKKASYWYIARDDMPVDKKLPDLDKSKALVLKVGKEIKLARSLNRFKCPAGEGGCQHCKPLEKIVAGKAVFVGNNEHGSDMYALFENPASLPSSEIL